MMRSMLGRITPVWAKIEIEKIAYQKRCSPYTSELSEWESEIVATIKRDGLMIIPNFMPTETARTLAELSYKKIEEQRQAGTDAIPQYWGSEDYGVFRLRDCDEVHPEIKAFFDNESIMRIARAVTTDNIKSHQRMLEVRDRVGHVSNSDVYHFDRPHWKYKFKSHLLLNDVGPDQAPLRYLVGSFRNAPWRRRQELEDRKFGSVGPNGHFFIHEIEHLIKEHDLEEVVCTGTAGTLVLFDARGLHRGTTLCTERRALLGNYFEM